MPNPTPVCDRVLLTGIVLDALVGIHAEERTGPQPIEIDLELAADLAPAARSDAIADTVDYERVEARVREVVEASRCLLLEALAQRVIEVIFEEKPVVEVRITIRKLRPRVGGRMGISLTRTRP